MENVGFLGEKGILTACTNANNEVQVCMDMAGHKTTDKR